MATDSVELIKQRASDLTPNEKLDLATYLIEQVWKTRVEASNESWGGWS
jgi:hypothetical protein